jgi:hypothetical protein
MRDNIIRSLKPHVSYKKRLNVPIYPLFLTSSYKYKASPFIDNNSRKFISHINIPQNSFHHKENEILPTITWEISNSVSIPNSDINDCAIENIGFIILRHVKCSKTNEYWKECYRCIKKFYPKNRILIIDDNSDYTYVTNELLENTMVIQSEFPKRGEFLPYYYYLKTKFCETAVILHDSVFIKKYIIFNVNNYRIIFDFGRECISDTSSSSYQINMLSAINSEKLNNFYNKKDFNLWNGCFGCMSVIKYDYLKSIDNEFRIACLIPHITCRDARCAFERIIGCLLQVNIKESSFFGSIHKYCRWGLSYDEYIQNKYSNHLPLIKIWTGR